MGRKQKCRSSPRSSTSSEKKSLKKGPWTAEEDQKLSDYVHTHGVKNWTFIPSEAGLDRDKRSCRLRWVNYLKPGVRRGKFSQDEEDLILRLHTLIGNRWSLIAGRLPGRTDNEIKNHWKCHLHKKSLTLKELNLKLNQNLENEIETHNSIVPTSLVCFTMDPNTNPADISSPHESSNGLYALEATTPTGELLDGEFNFDIDFDFLEYSEFLETKLLEGSSETGAQEA